MDEFVPLSRSSDGQLTTQFTMTTIEELGLLKMDFLGLRTLTVIQNAVKMLEKRGKRLDMRRISYEDKKVYDAIGTGKCDGIFQLESAGMKSFMKELKPKSLEDVIAGISLYRPGPMDFIPQYIKGKNNPRAVTYRCPQLKPILEPTYGCIVYQEQVMQIVRDLGGYSLGRSDLVRRAMSKKKQEVMVKERQNFIYGNEAEGVPGCVANGISAEVADQIYDEMMDFAKYAFNKSHAACYAVVAYQTAYLKTYYPVEFMAALMTSVIENGSKVSEYIETCRTMGISLLPPDINRGEWGFSVDGRDILYGLSAIKGLGRSVVESIEAERRLAGPFRDLKDLITRLTGKEINKRTIESFIKAGALDSLPGSRRQKMMVYADLMDQKAKDQKDSISGQMSLFDFMGEEERSAFDVTFPDVEEFPKAELLAMEKEVLGIYVSGHPLDDDRDRIRRHVTARAEDFVVDEDTGEATVREGQSVILGGMISEVTLKLTKKNQNMAFVTLEDLTGSLEILVFPRDFEQNRPMLREDNRIYVRGRVSLGADDPKGKLICERMIGFDDVPRDIWLQFSDKDDYNQNYASMESLRDGRAMTVFLASERAVKRIPGRKEVSREAEDDFIKRLQDAFGSENVRIVEKKLEELWKVRYTSV